MKQLACIALCFIHMLNIMGGYLLFVGMKYRNKVELSSRLDMDNYAGSQAITIKLPLSEAYGADNENYQRVDGDFEFEGITYRMVKQKFYKDTVYIVCYKDEASISLNAAIKDYVKSYTDRPSDKKSEHKTSDNSIKDYLVAGKTEFTSGRHGVLVKHLFLYHNSYSHFNCFPVDHPPQIIC